MHRDYLLFARKNSQIACRTSCNLRVAVLSFDRVQCSNSGCLMELAQQLAVIMVGKQVINNAQEVLWPKLKAWWQRRVHNLDLLDEGRGVAPAGRRPRWEEDLQLIPYEGLFDEYLEMVLQFGFVTIFVAAFPLAPLFALLNNWFEIRLDAQKLVCETRRPPPERAQNIGVWFSILSFLVHLAVISNVRVHQFLIVIAVVIVIVAVYIANHRSLEACAPFA